MKEVTDRALETARTRGGTYADIRIVRRETQNIEVKNGIVQTLSLGDTYGFGIRVVANGAWGFASSHRLENAEIDRVAALAVAIAKASAISKASDVDLGPEECHVGTYATPMKIDPFQVSLEKKIDYLLSSDKEARAVTEEAIVRHIAHFGGSGTGGYLGSVSEKGNQLNYDDLLATTLLHGSAETVIARLRELQARAGMTSLLLHYPPYYGREKAMRSLKLFAERVIPAFRPPARRVAAAE